jgi:hypothetical protein
MGNEMIHIEVKLPGDKACIDILNDGSLPGAVFGNYDAALYYPNAFFNNDDKRSVIKVKVENHRRSDGWVKLLHSVLGKINDL